MMTRVPPGTRAAAACDRRAEAANSPPPATRQYDYSARTRHDHAPAKPIRSPKSIEQLIKLLDGDPEEIYKAAQDVLGIDVKKPLNRKIVLSRAQCIDLLTAIGRKPTRESAETKARKADPPPLPRADTAKGAAADDGPRAKAADAGGEATDVPAALAGLAFPKLRHRLYIHPEVCDRLSAWPHLHRRLGIMVQHLAANGRSTVVKGCRNDNKGWRRSPLGGNNGMQWYLWWTPAGGGAAARLDAPEDAIVIRDVRHHDDHRTLKPGETGDYLTVGQADEMIDDIAAPPWTDDQKNFIDGREAVRVLLGRPGSGKTTALWRAVEARAGERVLYLTWSPKLAEQARRHLASFAPATTEVVTRDFHTFLGEMSGTDVPARTLAESRALFTDAIRRAGREMGPWSRRPDALHGELRGMYFGQPGGADAEADDGGPIVHIADEEYIRLRDHHAGVGEKSAKALLRIAHALLRDPDKLAAIYPDLAAATTALRRIRGKQLPEGFDRFDRIVVDEVQDLTMLETALVIELAREIGTRRGRRPVMLLAGDPGQTVRPTGFEWSPLITMLKEMLQQPAIVHLDEHLRCPAAIAGIVDRAADWYVQIDKEARPTKQRRQTSAEHVDAQILTVRTDSEREAVQLLSDLHDIEGVAVINPAHEPPAWAPPEHRRRILDPAEAKGLEYQTVCVLDVAKLLVKLKPEDLGYGRSEDLDQAQKRTAIDHLRVSLSRATETLVFLDVSPDGEADAEMEKLVTRSTAIPYTPRDVVEHLRHSETSTEERVLTRIDEARNLIDTSTALACERAGQALHLLGDPDLPNGVPDIDIRTAAAFTMLEAIAVRTVTDPGVNDRETLRPILETAENAITEVVSSRARRFEPADDGEELPGAAGAPVVDLVAAETVSEGPMELEGPPLSPEATPAMNPVIGNQHRTTYVKLVRWMLERDSHTAIELLAAARLIDEFENPNGHWFRRALGRHAQELRNQMEKGAETPELATTMSANNVAKWLELTGYAGDAPIRARNLCGQAFDTTLKSLADVSRKQERETRLADAAALLRSLGPDKKREGRLLEADGQPDAAIKAYTDAGRPKDVLRILRNEGRWEQAEKLAVGETKADLQWLAGLDAYVSTRPEGQNRRLRNGERERLEKLLDTIQKRPPRKTAGPDGR